MNKIIIILCLSATYLHGQNKGIITLPIGEGGGDSLGNVIPDTRVLLGQGTNLATSTDSLAWVNPALVVNGDVTVADDPFGGSWNGSFEVPTKNALWDEITTVSSYNFAQFDLTANGNRYHTFTSAYDLNIDNVDALRLEGITIQIENPSGNGGIDINGSGVLISSPAQSVTITTGSGNIDLSPFTGDIVLDAGDILFEDALTINNNWDTILVRNNVTGEIQGRDASSFGDLLGTAFTTGRVIFGDGTTTGGSSANLFWDNSSSELAIGHTSPSGDLHVISTDPTNRSSLIGQNDNSATAFTSTFPALSLRNNNTTANNYVRMNFQDASSTAAAAIASQITDHTSDYGTLEFWTRSSGGFSQKMVIVEGGNVGIGTTPNTYGKLDISSTTGALIVPRMTTTQRDAMTAVAGMVIFNTSTSTFQGYTTAWNNL